jgi:deoxyribose-phosphate aldolase
MTRSDLGERLSVNTHTRPRRNIPVITLGQQYRPKHNLTKNIDSLFREYAGVIISGRYHMSCATRSYQCIRLPGLNYYFRPWPYTARTFLRVMLVAQRRVTAEQYLANPRSIASLIDHTLLKPEAAESGIVQLCREAREYGFKTVCVNPCWVDVARRELSNSSVVVCTVIGFPLGANLSEVKLNEARLALRQGAAELDMVQNVGALRSGNGAFVGAEISSLANLTHAAGAILKVIIETSVLSEEEKTVSCRLALAAGADFVKTSTGFSAAGATESDVRLMRAAVGPSIGVKASGGVRTLDALRRMVEAGATRVGTSSGVQILRDAAEPRMSAASVPAAGPDSY